MLNDRTLRNLGAALACAALLSACGGSDDKKPASGEKAPAAKAAPAQRPASAPKAAEEAATPRRVAASERAGARAAEARRSEERRGAERPASGRQRQEAAPSGGESVVAVAAAPVGSTAGTSLEQAAAALNLPKPHPDVLASRLFLGPEKPVLDVRPAAEKEIADAYAKARK